MTLVGHSGGCLDEKVAQCFASFKLDCTRWLLQHYSLISTQSPISARAPRLALEHGTKAIVVRSWDAFSWTAAVFSSRLAMAEGESDKEALAHFVIAIGHGFQGLLLLMHLLVLCHVCFVAEVVEITSISLRVQLGHEWGSGLPQCYPVNFGKILVAVNVLAIGEAASTRVDAPV